MRGTKQPPPLRPAQAEDLTQEKLPLMRQVIRPFLKRMVEESLEGKFKDPQGPFRTAVVCSMWTTGFDAPPHGATV